MLIKLTGHKTGAPVLVESDNILTAEEITDVFKDDEAYTSLLLVSANCHTTIGVNETCEEILEKIEDSDGGYL